MSEVSKKSPETVSISEVGLKVPEFKCHPDCTVAEDGYMVFRWPEFQALAFRLGIDITRPMKRLVLDLQEGACPVILIEQRGSDAVQAALKRMDTTTVHNKEFRTYAPPRNP